MGQPIREARVTTPDAGSGDVPNNSYCQDVATWLPSDATAEEDLRLALVALHNALRCDRGGIGGIGGMGGIGGIGGMPSQVSALTPSPELRCSARHHSRDLAQQTTPAGDTVEGRIRLAGYASNVASELIVRDQPQYEQALGQLIVVNCDVLSDPRMVAIGVGKFQNVWTVDLAGARSP